MSKANKKTICKEQHIQAHPDHALSPNTIFSLCMLETHVIVSANDLKPSTNQQCLCLGTSLNTDHEGWEHTMRWRLLLVLLLLQGQKRQNKIQPEDTTQRLLLIISNISLSADY